MADLERIIILGCYGANPHPHGVCQSALSVCNQILEKFDADFGIKVLGTCIGKTKPMSGCLIEITPLKEEKIPQNLLSIFC